MALIALPGGFVKRPMAVFYRLIIILVLLPVSVWAAPVSLTILHTNDTHGHLLPFSYPAKAPPGLQSGGPKTRSDIGGIARRATLVRQLRQELGARGTTVWLIDAGDFSQGSAFSIEYRGAADIAAMNAAGYDFAVLGNHEFSHPLEHLHKLIGLARYPVLCANAAITEPGRTLTPAYSLQRLGPLRVALFGLLTHTAAAYPAARQGVAIQDPIRAAQKMVAVLCSQADILIAVSHCGDKLDRRLARLIPEIDVIVGGHSHSRLPNGIFVWRDEELKADDVNGTIIVQNHQWGGELGRLDLLFVQDSEGAWHVGRYRAGLIPVTAQIAPDPATAAVVASFWDPIAAHYGAIVGQATADIVTRGDDRAEYNLMADAIRAEFKTDFVLENIGGVRAPLVKGAITRADLAAMDPFDNTIVTLRISGARLKRLLSETQPAVAGIRYGMRGGLITTATIDGRAIEDRRLYHGAVNSFFAQHYLQGVELRDSGRQRREVLTDYIVKEKKISPAYDGRRRLR